MKKRKSVKYNIVSPQLPTGGDVQRRKLRFSARELVSNTVIASAGAGIAAVSATGAIFPAVVAGLAGGLIGYTVMNEIPKEKE